MKQLPKVSVCMITYGHAQFIEEAINGVFMQKCDFEIELIISNDSSPDKTDEIIRNILSNHERGNLIKYYNQEGNMGIMPNFIFTLTHCTGKYIALCEGDDYWTDPYKLQKQIDFLEANPDFSVYHHRFKIWDQANEKYRPHMEPHIPENYDIEFLSKKNVIGTLTVVFRNQFGIPNWFEDLSYGDYPLHLLNATRGKIKYSPEEMAVYRSHKASATGRLTNVESPLFLVTSLEVLYASNFANNGEVKKNLGAQLVNLYLTLFYHYYEIGAPSKKEGYFHKVRGLKNSFDSILIDQKILLRVYLLQIQDLITSGNQSKVASLISDFNSESVMFLVNEITNEYAIKNNILKSYSYRFGNKIIRSLKLFSYKRRKKHGE